MIPFLFNLAVSKFKPRKTPTNPNKPLLMKFLSPQFFTVLFFSFVLFSCSQDDAGIYLDEATTSTKPADDTATYSAIESEIIDLVNKHRESKGLSALKPLTIVSTVADGHTNYMIETGDISHTNFSERTTYLMKNAKAKSVGENIAYGYQSAQTVMDGWLKSTGHRKNIENSKYTHIGISNACNSKGRNYFTQIFIKQ